MTLRITIDFDDIQTYLVRSVEWIVCYLKLIMVLIIQKRAAIKEGGGYRNLDSQKLHILYTSPYVKKDEMGWECGTYGGELPTVFW